jgi:metallophosphoesterase (TIGR03767 family)
MIPVTTAKASIVRTEADERGWRGLTRAPGEPHGADLPEGEVLACLWHLSDLHLCDAESPARLEHLDRLADPDSPLAEEIGEVGTYRPQEILTVQVAVQMVHTVNRIARGPVTGSHVDAVLITGDVTDNCQQNELAWYRTVIDGGAVTPASGGAASSWCGVSDPATWDEHYWHPDGPPAGYEPDRPTRLFGYPRVPGLIEAARQPVHSPGLEYEVLSVHGNHDALLQGTVAADPSLRARAVGSRLVTGLPDGFDPRGIAAAVAPIGPAHYPPDAGAPARVIAADARRELVESGDFARSARRQRNYWMQQVGGLRVISLDTVNPHGGWQGSLDEEQFAWLRDELAEPSGLPVVIASHHPSPTMTNDYAPDGHRRVLGPEVVALLLEHPEVILWVAGHVHFNAAIQHGGDAGFWEITTSSLIDWPQQGRILEFLRVGHDYAIVSTVVDHDSPIAWDGTVLDVRAMASVSRLLAANDYQRRDPTPLNELRAGSPEVRNTVWWARRSDPLPG